MMVSTVVGVRPIRKIRFLPVFETSSSVDRAYSSRLPERSQRSLPASVRVTPLLVRSKSFTFNSFSVLLRLTYYYLALDCILLGGWDIFKCLAASLMLPVDAISRKYSNCLSSMLDYLPYIFFVLQSYKNNIIHINDNGL